MLSLLVATLALSAHGCADGFAGADGGVDGEVDCPDCVDSAAPPASRFDFGLPPINPDQGSPDPTPEPDPDPGMMPVDPNMECDPGSRVAPCALCGINGRPEMPENDPLCMTLECPGAESYARIIEGEEVICQVTRRVPPGGNCAELGICHTDIDAYCGEPMEEEVARITPTPCNYMEGCTGATPPNVVDNQPGAPCNTYGVCNIDGGCTAPALCADLRIVNSSAFCNAGEQFGEQFCEFYVNQGFRMSCTDFCMEAGMRCSSAWQDGGQCVRDQAVGCAEAYSEFICRCSPT